MLALFDYIYGEYWVLFSVVLSLCIGSFINVVIYRLPKMLERETDEQVNEHGAAVFNFFLPGSSCPHCFSTVRLYDNIPLISWLLLGGRCRDCRQRISLRYPLVELITLLAGVSMASFIGVGIDWFFMVVFFSLLLALSVIDMERQLLPDCLTLSLLWVGLLWHTLEHSWFLPTAVIGAIAGYLTLWLLYWAFRLATGREGLGYGDFKLLAALGAWGGYEVLPHILLIGSLGSLIWLLAQRAMRARNWSQPLAFGPGLALAGSGLVLYRWVLQPFIG